jgi:hypothetical protein
MDKKTKTCPYCCEEIKAEATRCRWCRSKLAPSSVSKEWYRDLPGRRFLGVASVLANLVHLVHSDSWRFESVILLCDLGCHTF